jgi:undecaprenyl-diphosphatase
LFALLSTWVLLGQRAISSVLAFGWLSLRAIRERQARPLITMALATLALNLSVGVVKIVIGRLGPLQLGAAAVAPGASRIFSDGMIFPSGHTSNAVVTWVLLGLLARRHQRMWAAVGAAVATSVGLTTLYLGTHWLSDVLAGGMAGALVLLVLPAFEPVVDWLEDRARRLLRPRMIHPACRAFRIPGGSPGSHPPVTGLLVQGEPVPPGAARFALVWRPRRPIRLTRPASMRPRTALLKHTDAPHTTGNAGRLEWLRAGVLGANDGRQTTSGLPVLDG